MKPRILIAEDDLALRTGLTDSLEGEGYVVTATADGDRAAQLLSERDFDLAVLDLMLPGRGGLDVLRALRTRDADLPVLVLTARSDESDKVLGLELGADDYMTKPFGLRELLARVRSLLRRAQRGTETPGTFAIGDCRIDLAAFTAELAGVTHPLSAKEAAMLALLWSEAGHVVSRSRFLDEVWGSRFVGTRTVDTHVLNLRKKIEREPSKPRYLLTAHGVGYKLVLTSS